MPRPASTVLRKSLEADTGRLRGGGEKTPLMGDPVPPPAFKCWIPALVIAAVLLLVLLLYVMLCVIWPFCIVWPLQSGALQPATSTSYGSSPPATLPAHAILSPPSSQHPPPTSPGTTSPGTTPGTTKPGTTTPVIGPGTIAPTDHCTEGSVWDVHSGGCFAPVPFEQRGCYPRSSCEARYASSFGDELSCIPQGFNGECSSALSELHGFGIVPNAKRGDDYANHGYYGTSSYIRLFEFLGREVMILEDRTSAPRHKTSQNLPKPPQTSTPRWPPLYTPLGPTRALLTSLSTDGRAGGRARD